MFVNAQSVFKLVYCLKIAGVTFWTHYEKHELDVVMERLVEGTGAVDSCHTMITKEDGVTPEAENKIPSVEGTFVFSK